MNGIRKMNKEYFLILSLFAISFIIRILFASKFLDDWDSVQFALGIHDFDIAAHQPHPPGYPAYIFIADLFYIFIRNDTLTLTFISALFGALSVVFTYLLGKELFNNKIGTLSAVILSLTPTHLVFSVVAMNDIVFLCFLIASVYFLFTGLKDWKPFFLGSFLAGFSVGIRPQNFLLVGGIYLLFLFWRKDVRLTLVSLLATGLGGLLWFAPVSYLSGGPIRYLILTRSQIDAHDRYNFTLGQAYAFVNLLIDGWTVVLFIFILLAMAGLLIKARNGGLKLIRVNNIPLILLAVWLSLSVFTCIALYILNITRYLLPVFVPLAFVISYGIVQAGNISSGKYAKIIVYSIACLAIIVMGAQALSTVYVLSGSQPAPVQAASFIQGDYDKNDTVIVAQDSYRHFYYYLPDYGVTYGDLSSKKLLNKSIVISETPITLGQDKKIAEFYRSEDVYLKHNRVVLFESSLYDTMLFASGFYSVEYWNDKPARWMTNKSAMVYYSNEDADKMLGISLKSYHEPKNVSIYVNDRLVYQKEVPVTFEHVRIPVHLVNGMNIIKIYSEEWNVRPADLGGNSDSRPLSFAIQNVSIE